MEPRADTVCDYATKPKTSKKFCTCDSCFGLAPWPAGEMCSFLHEQAFQGWLGEALGPTVEAHWAWVFTKLQGRSVRKWVQGGQRQLARWAVAVQDPVLPPGISWSSCPVPGEPPLPPSGGHNCPWSPAPRQEPEPRLNKGSGGCSLLRSVGSECQLLLTALPRTAGRGWGDLEVYRPNQSEHTAAWCLSRSWGPGSPFRVLDYG